jgi:hypothetical protein
MNSAILGAEATGAGTHTEVRAGEIASGVQGGTIPPEKIGEEAARGPFGKNAAEIETLTREYLNQGDYQGIKILAAEIAGGGLSGTAIAGAASGASKFAGALKNGRLSAVLRSVRTFIYTPLLPGSQTGSVTVGNVWKVNPFELIPTHRLTMSRKDFADLKSSLKATGKVRESIKYVVHEGKKYIVDGHHRARIAKELGWPEVEVEEVSLPFLGYRTAADLLIGN